jgi:hypothetical protein
MATQPKKDQGRIDHPVQSDRLDDCEATKDVQLRFSLLAVVFSTPMISLDS